MSLRSAFLPDTLPDGWIQDRIRDRLRRVVGGDWGADAGSADELVDVVVVRVADMDGIGIALDDPTIRAVTPASLETRRLRPDSLVLEKSGGGEKQNVGRVALVGMLDDEAICSNFMAVMDVDSVTSSSFLNYAFSALYDTDMNFPSVKQTTGIQNLDVVAYLSTHIAFPAQDEQKRIVAYLDASCRAIDAAVAAKRAQVEVLDDLRATTIQHFVTRGFGKDLMKADIPYLDHMPKGWHHTRLKQIADIRYGLGQPPAELDGGLPMIRATNVDHGEIRTEKLIYVDPNEIPEGKRSYLKENDIVVVRSGAYTGDSAIIPKEWEGAVAGYDMVATVNRASPKFVAYVLLSKYMLRDQIIPLTMRAAQPHLNAEELGSVLLVLPSLMEEQEKIVSALEVELEKQSKVRDVLEKQIVKLTAYRKSLIHECVTGQRRISGEDVNRVTAHAATLA